MTDRELIHQLVDKVLDVQEQTGHFSDAEISNCGYDIHVWVMRGGFDENKDFSLSEGFDKDNEARIRSVIDYLDNLLKKDPRRMRPSRVQVTKKITLPIIHRESEDCK